MENINKKAMRDVFNVRKDSNIIDQILQKQKRRGYRTFEDPTIWKKKDEVVSGQGVINENLYNEYKNSSTRYIPYTDHNKSSRKSLKSNNRDSNTLEVSSNKSSGRKRRLNT